MKLTFTSIIFTVCFCAIQIKALPDVIRIGGIFDPYDESLVLAFQYAVDYVNKDMNVLSGSTLQAQVDRVPSDDSFQAAKKVCQLLRAGTAAIFGPQSENTANHVQSICDAMEIPHIEARWDYKLNRDAYSLNLYPHPASLSKAYYDVLKELKWKKFVILYDSNESLVRLQSLLQAPDMEYTVRQIDEGDDWRPLLKDIKKSQETRFVIDVHQDKLYAILRQANQIGLMKAYHNYFITSLDLHLVDLEDFKYGDTNITALRIVNPDQEEVKALVEKWTYGELLQYNKYVDPDSARITTEAALMFDAVHLFARALDDLDNSNQVEISALYCEGDDTWQHGNSLINYMKLYSARRYGDHSINQQYRHGMTGLRNHGPGGQREHNSPMYNRQPDQRGYDSSGGYSSYGAYGARNMSTIYNQLQFPQGQVIGLTGVIKFDTEGFRTDFQLDIVKLESKTGLTKVGTWARDTGANFTRANIKEAEAFIMKLHNRTLKVTTALTPPYTMLKETSDQLEGNDRYEGFCIDLIHEIAKELGFNYTFQIVGDGNYGSMNKKTKEWNGMVRELLDHKADLGIVDFTITYEREAAIDFSMPFMNLGISIIYKKPVKKAPSLFSFMSPFSIDVWIYMATAYLGVSVLLFILARMVPKEWDSPHPCIQDPEELENCFTLLNCMWFIIGTFLCQGGDIAPRAVSTRIVAGIWWFFTLIMISSYTANLAAFLTVERMEAAINSAEDLAKQTKIKYGLKGGGSTYGFFADSKIPTYQRMWSSMNNARPSVFTQSNNEGVDRVAKADGMYAFLMESSSIEYTVERRCELMQVGGLLDSKSYGIALPPGSPYTSAISSAILRLKESGVLHNLKTRWWKERKGGGKCMVDVETDAASSAELGLANVGGVFVVMTGGCVAAMFTACCEFFWKARKLATADDETFSSAMTTEFKFIFNFGENSKPVRKKCTPPDTDSSTIYSSSTNNYGYK